MPGRDDQFARMAADLGAQARANADYQQTMQGALAEATNRPVEVRDIKVSGTGVAELGGGVRALVVALPSGIQLRIHLDAQSSIGLSQALAAPFKQSIEAAPEPSGS